jgi:hypothetical protein
VYELAATLAGVALYFLDTRGSSSAAVAACGACAAIGLMGVIVGVWASPRRGRLAATASWFWSLLLVTVGAAIAWLAIAIGAHVVNGRTRDTRNEVLIAVVAAAVSLVIARTAKLSERLGSKWLTFVMLWMRGGRGLTFPNAKEVDDPQRVAYQAMRDDTFNGGGPVCGWGFGARAKRFELVAFALTESTRSHSPVPATVDVPPAGDPTVSGSEAAQG